MDIPTGAGMLHTEKTTVAAMIEIYCRKKHGADSCPCDECAELLEYALDRLDNCCFGEEKPRCSACPVHCYSPGMRERIREVMRFAGPRMALAHPVLSLKHLFRRKIPVAED